MTDTIKSFLDSEALKVLSKCITIIMIPWVGWQTVGQLKSENFQARGDRFSIIDAQRLEMRINNQISAIPNITEDIKQIQTDLREIRIDQRKWIDDLQKELRNK